MDFFQYANIVDAFATFETRWLTYLVGGLCFAVVYVFLVVGLFIIAKREGLKNKWMIFIPILNTYYFGECSKKNKLFGVVDARIVSAICSFLELTLVVANILYYVSFETLISSGYLTEQLYEDTYYGSYYVYQLNGSLPADLNWANWCFFKLPDVVTWWLDILYMVAQLATFVLFFKTYAARRYLIFSITGVLFPIQGILVYTIKGNKGYNYNQFIKKEQQKQYQAYQQQMRNNPNNNPYNNQYGGNPYSSNPYDNPYSTPPAGGSDEDPFGGSGQQASNPKPSDDDDPFSEFGSGGDNSSSNSGDPFSQN
ncbi:MAG: hypothetical protein LUD51_06585 [Clostridia bacterium]|nr:hypothetical protein [Clostridia bacterium]